MSEHTPFEDRLRRHLDRVADQPAPPDLERRIMERVDGEGRPSRTWAMSALVIVLVLTLAVLFTVVAGNQTGNVFSNISSGLGT